MIEKKQFYYPGFWTTFAQTYKTLLTDTVRQTLGLLGTPDARVPGHQLEQTESLQPSVTWDRQGWPLCLACPC